MHVVRPNDEDESEEQVLQATAAGVCDAGPFEVQQVDPLCEASCCEVLDVSVGLPQVLVGEVACMALEVEMDVEKVAVARSFSVGIGKATAVGSKANKSARRRRQHEQHVVDLFLSARAMYVAMVELRSTYADKVKSGTLHGRFPSPGQALAMEVVAEAV